MQSASLDRLNKAFNTQARAHELDPRFLIGATPEDIKLAFVPGVKAVIVEGALDKTASVKQRRYEARHIVSNAIQAQCETLRIDGLKGFSSENTIIRHWHADSYRKPEGRAVRVITMVNGPGTEYVLGDDEAIAKTCTLSDDVHDAVTLALQQTILIQCQAHCGDILAFNIPAFAAPLIAPNADRLRETLLHRTPAGEGFRQILRHDGISRQPAKVLYTP